MIEMTIDNVRVSPTNDRRVVILKERAGERYLPIWIGNTEANAIAAKLQRVTAHRPMSHDLLCLVIQALGGRVDCVSLTELRGETFYAKIVLNVRGGQTEVVDSRPSDALAVATKAGSPIYVEETILQRAGILFDKETGEPTLPGKESEETGGKGVSEDELRRMSAFRDFISKLDLDDLDKHRS